MTMLKKFFLAFLIPGVAFAGSNPELLQECKTEHWGKAGLAYSRAMQAREKARGFDVKDDYNYADVDMLCGHLWRENHDCKEHPNQPGC